MSERPERQSKLREILRSGKTSPEAKASDKRIGRKVIDFSSIDEQRERQSKIRTQLNGKNPLPKFEGPGTPDIKELNEIVDIDWSEIPASPQEPEVAAPIEKQKGRLARSFRKAREALGRLGGNQLDDERKEQRRRIIGVVAAGVALTAIGLIAPMDAQPSAETTVPPTHQVTNYDQLRNSGATDEQAQNIVAHPADFQRLAEWDAQYTQAHPDASRQTEVDDFNKYVQLGQ